MTPNQEANLRRGVNDALDIVFAAQHVIVEALESLTDEQWKTTSFFLISPIKSYLTRIMRLTMTVHDYFSGGITQYHYEDDEPGKAKILIHRVQRVFVHGVKMGWTRFVL